MSEENQTSVDMGVNLSEEASPAYYPRRRWGRLILRIMLLVAVPAAALYAGAFWYEVSGRYISTENAYVKAHVIAVSPDIDGRVVGVSVEENQAVTKNEVLFHLDPRPYQIASEMARAKREGVRQAIAATRAEYRQIEAEVGQADADVAYHQTEARRQRALARKGVTTKTRLESAEHNLNKSRKAVIALKQKIRTVLARLGDDPTKPAEHHPSYQEAEAELEIAKLNLGYTEVLAPADGVVTRMKLEPGEWVEEGQPAFGIIATDRIWIEANLKETQLTHVRENQSVEVEIDAYPDVIWRAKVASISPATGAEFAVLPPQNASGNWVKVVQRLPVRIEIETEADANKPPLRAGMTATVSIDTGHERRLLSTVTEALAKLKDGNRR